LAAHRWPGSPPCSSTRTSIALEDNAVAYSTETDVAIAAGGHEPLVELCDLANEADKSDGAPLPTPWPASALLVLAEAIADADALINSYVAKQRAVPLVPVPPVIRRMSAEEAVFLLRSRKQIVSEYEQAKHEANVRWLEGLSRGTTTLGVDPQPAKSALVAPVVVERTNAEVTARSLRGLW